MRQELTIDEQVARDNEGVAYDAERVEALGEVVSLPIWADGPDDGSIRLTPVEMVNDG